MSEVPSVALLHGRRSEHSRVRANRLRTQLLPQPDTHIAGYGGIFRALRARVCVTLSAGTPLCPYGLPTVGS
jgi:hypothetical protein